MREGREKGRKEFNEDTRQLDRRFAFSAFTSRPFTPYFAAHREAIRGATRVPKGFKERGSRPILLFSLQLFPLSSSSLTHEREPTRARPSFPPREERPPSQDPRIASILKIPDAKVPGASRGRYWKTYRCLLIYSSAFNRTSDGIFGRNFFMIIQFFPSIPIVGHRWPIPGPAFLHLGGSNSLLRACQQRKPYTTHPRPFSTPTFLSCKWPDLIRPYCREQHPESHSFRSFVNSF